MKTIITLLLIFTVTHNREYLGISYTKSSPDFRISTPKNITENFIYITLLSIPLNSGYYYYIYKGSLDTANILFDSLTAHLTTPPPIKLRNLRKDNDSLHLFAFYQLAYSANDSLKNMALNEFDLWELPVDTLPVDTLPVDTLPVRVLPRYKAQINNFFKFDLLGRLKQ